MTVAVGVVDAIDRRPIFFDTKSPGGIAPLLTAVRPVPIANEVFHRVRCALERVVLGIDLTRLDLANFIADRQHRIAKAIELCFRF